MAARARLSQKKPNSEAQNRKPEMLNCSALNFERAPVHRCRFSVQCIQPSKLWPSRQVALDD